MKRSRKRVTIVRRLSVSLIAMGIAIWIIAEIIGSVALYYVIENEIVQNLEQMSEQSIQYLDTVMRQFEQDRQFLQSENSLYLLIKEYKKTSSEKKKAQIEEILNVCYSSFENVYGIAMILEGEIFQNIGGDIKKQNILQEEWYLQYKKEKRSRQYSALVDRQGNENGEEKNYIFLVYPYKNKTVEGDLIFLIPFSAFQEGLKTYQDEEIELEIYNSEEKILYRNKNISEHKQVKGIEIKQKTRLGQWTMIVRFSKEKILEKAIPLFIVCFFVLFSVLLTIWAVILKMIKKNLRPIQDFSDQMEMISNGNEDSKVSIHSGDELENLAETFNKMMDRIQNSVKEQIQAENKQKQLEYALIHAQIDPHFIYKALNIIIYLGQCGENELLIKVTRALIEILQDKLRIDQIDIYDTLEKELEIIQSYIKIWNVYYGDKICFIAEADEDVRRKKLPKNIIQPLVENAIFHGLLLNEDEEGTILGGTVYLRVKQKGEYLYIEVEDDGYGMTKEQIKRVFFEKLDQNIEKGKHIGIRNIRQRLEWIYKEEYSISIESELKKGTKIVLCIREG